MKEICELLGISRNTYYKYTRASEKLPPPRPDVLLPPENQPQVIKVRMWLRVENNSKFVRGKGKVREEIERQILRHYGMEKPNKERGEYLLKIPYTTEEELDRIIYQEIWQEAERMADLRNCFTEGDIILLDDPDRRW